MANFDNIIQEINTNLPDNNAQEITAKKLRDTLIDLTDAIDDNETALETTVGTTITNIVQQMDNLNSSVDERLANLGAVSEETYTLNYSSAELRVYKKDGTYVTLGGAATGRTLIYNLPSNGTDYNAYVSAIGSSATYANCVSVIYWDSSNNMIGYQWAQGEATGGEIRKLTVPEGATKVGIYATPYSSQSFTYRTVISINDINDNVNELTTDVDSITERVEALEEELGIGGSGYIEHSNEYTAYWCRYDTGALKKWASGDYGTSTSMCIRNFIFPDGITFSDYTFTALYGTAANSNYSNFASVAYYDSSNNYLGGVVFYQAGSSTNNSEHELTIPENAHWVRLFTYSTNATVKPTLYFESKDGTSTKKTLLIAEKQTLTQEQQQQVKDNLGIEDIGKTYTLNPAQTLTRVYNKDGSYITMQSTSNGRTLVYNIPSEGTNQKAYVSGIGASSTYANCVSVIYWDSSNNVAGWEYPQGASPNGVKELNIPDGATKVGIWVNPYSNGEYTYNVGIIPVSEDDVISIVNTTVNGTKIPLDLKGKKVSVIGDSIACFGTETQTRTQGYNAPYFIIKSSDVGKEIQSYITWPDVYINATSSTLISPATTIGGVTLTASMIGTLQTFTPVAADVGKALGVPRWAQNYTSKPWWQVFIDAIGAELCNNASWSGSEMCEISPTSTRYSAFRMSEAYSEYTLNRVCNRDDDGNTITPDIILICRGTNDWGASYPDPEGGSASVAESLEFPDMATFVGVVDGANNANFAEAYIWTILRLREKYPFATIVPCTILDSGRGSSKKFPPLNGSNDSISDFNDVIRKVADYMGCPLIDIAKCGITWYNCYPTYISDDSASPTHPNTTGHKVMGKKAVADLNYILTTKGTLTPYTVTYNLTNCKCNNMNTTVWGNSSYLGKLIPNSGTIGSVTVTMNGSSVTSTVYSSSDNSIRIKRITGNIVITATAA